MKRPCKNCKQLEEQHQDGPYYKGLCEFERLSIGLQHEINMGNIIPEADWDWIAYNPMDNLEWLEWKSEHAD